MVFLLPRPFVTTPIRTFSIVMREVEVFLPIADQILMVILIIKWPLPC